MLMIVFETLIMLMIVFEISTDFTCTVHVDTAEDNLQEKTSNLKKIKKGDNFLLLDYVTSQSEKLIL